MRNAERGTRNTRVGVAARGLTQLFRVPTSAFRLCLFVAACTPITTRPDFRPDPRALTVVLDARPERVTTVLDSLVAAESLEVARANVRDGYVETAWYDPQAHRTRYDPSRPERDLEVIASKEHEGYKIAQRLVDKLKQKFGVPKAAQEEGRPTPPPSPSPTPP